jgi:hypothetical protein
MNIKYLLITNINLIQDIINEILKIYSYFYRQNIYNHFMLDIHNDRIDSCDIYIYNHALAKKYATNKLLFKC